MKRKFFAFISLVNITLLLVACGAATTPSSTSSTTTPTTSQTLGDNTVTNIIIATQSGNYHTPLDSTPSLDGTTIYFTASGQNGPGVFSVPAGGGQATALFIGSPFVSPRSIAISPDGQQLYITDPGVGSGGEIFALSLSGGSPITLQGSEGTVPQNLDVVNQNGQQVVYFTGKDPSSGQPAVLTLPKSGEKVPTIIFKGSPLVNPDGVVVTSSGTIYITDHSAAGGTLGKVFKIQDSSLSAIVDQVRTGDPAGIALSPDESILLISSLEPNSLADQVLLVNLNNGQTGIVSKIIGQNHNDAGGLHASPGQKNILAWNGKSGGQGKGLVYTVQL